MKKTTRLVLLLLVSILTTTLAHAADNTMRFAQISKDIPEEFVYLHLKPQADAEALFGYRKGTFLMILDEANGWYHVSIGNQQGYIKTEKITFADSFSSTASLPVALANPTNPTTGWVNLRVGPSQESEGLVRATNGQEIIVIGENDDWAHVIFDGKLGFMMKEFLKMTGSMTVYEAKSIGYSLYTTQAAPPTSGKKPAAGTTTSASGTNGTYSMKVYMEAPNPKSTVSIEYPYFPGNDTLNALIYGKIQSILEYPSSYYPQFGFTAKYRAAVTLNNSKMVSIVFWGDVMIEKGRPGTVLRTLNVNLSSMKEVTLADLYTINTDFEAVLFTNGYFPSKPATSYNESSFSEILMLQMPENNPTGAFRFLDEVQCFLKPDGIVISLTSINGTTGIDRFEVQANYSDLQRFYLPSTYYWEK